MMLYILSYQQVLLLQVVKGMILQLLFLLIQCLYQVLLLQLMDKCVRTQIFNSILQGIRQPESDSKFKLTK